MNTAAEGMALRLQGLQVGQGQCRLCSICYFLSIVTSTAVSSGRSSLVEMNGGWDSRNPGPFVNLLTSEVGV